MRTPGGVFYRLRTGKQRAGTGHPYSAWFYAVSTYSHKTAAAPQPAVGQNTGSRRLNSLQG